MSRLIRAIVITLSAVMLVAALPGIADAQRRAVPRHPTHPPRAPVVRGQVFVGGYFYDPFWGPYPWWPRTMWYYPVYDTRAIVHVKIEPEVAEDAAAVYVDGYYAGEVNDFDGVFQGLPLTAGSHSIVLYLEGWRTVRSNVYLSAASSYTLRVAMERLPAGEASEPPDVSPPVPPPPAGSYRMPVTPPRATLPPRAAAPPPAAGFGVVDLFVQPASAEVRIDGQPWVSSDPGHFIVQVPAGSHRVEIGAPGFRLFSTDVEVREGETIPLSVSLITTVR
jgi:hypothetical protein